MCFIIVFRKKIWFTFHGSDSLASALDVKQTSAVLLRLDVTEARVDTASHDLDAAREERLELVRLVAHHLTVLDRQVVEKSVELDSLVRGGTLYNFQKNIIKQKNNKQQKKKKKTLTASSWVVWAPSQKWTLYKILFSTL